MIELSQVVVIAGTVSSPIIVKLIANWWAWELVPKRLAGRPTVKNTAKEVTRQPWKREPPLPAAANWHRHTERVLSGKYLPTWNTYLHTPAWQQGGRRGSKNPPRFASTKQQGDPQRSARIACKIMQKESGPENPKWATPHVTHANTGTPLAALARG